MTRTPNQQYWVENGQLQPATGSEDQPRSLIEERLHRFGHVRLTSGHLGSEVRWSSFAPSQASLFAAIEWLSSAQAPVILRYYISGWFEETGLGIARAKQRIEEIMQRGDRHLSQKIYIHDMPAQSPLVPQLMRQVLDEDFPAGDLGVECVLHEPTGHFIVERIGQNSLLAKLFGFSTSTYPCQAANTFGANVSKAYAGVLASGKKHYDQVLASLPFEGGEFRWLPYHRVIMPGISASGMPAVTILAQPGPVDFSII